MELIDNITVKLRSIVCELQIWIELNIRMRTVYQNERLKKTKMDGPQGVDGPNQLNVDGTGKCMVHSIRNLMVSRSVDGQKEMKVDFLNVRPLSEGRLVLGPSRMGK